MSSSGLALAELIAFMEESHVENRSTVFRLADLSKLYEARVNQLRGQFPLQARAHSTHLKKRLLQNVPGLVASNQGREVYLSYDEEVACTLKRQYNEEKDTESITMARLANSIRNDMFATSVSFTGQFDNETQIQGYKKIQIRSVDTDVVVLAVSTVSKLGGGLELWVAFGTGKDFRLIPAHEIAESLGPMRCYALPMFHSLTGCDTTSYFQHIGKRTAWKIWKLSDMLTTALCSLRKDPNNLQYNILQTVERFVILLYGRTSSIECIDAARKDLFVRKGRHLSLLPPTKAGGLDSSVGSGFAPWPRGRGFETQPSTVQGPTGWVGVSINTIM
ncbi:hypothetical protein ElyMa_004776500 [Elysia marginata]|uniref:Uncharacterized protein n=1 Tax=Elysia marginata TaxID=1093978 RepID=A0AAV4IK47_9GAST|nr:hypothetical protein ElyMa_004776500 [Elysia marginata]